MFKLSENFEGFASIKWNLNTDDRQHMFREYFEFYIIQAGFQYLTLISTTPKVKINFS